MRKFLIRFLIFCLPLIVLGQIPQYFLSEYYGNPCYQEKYDYFISNQDAYNTVFFGSSRTYRQIDPETFDKALQDYNIASFNLGAPSTFIPELYFIYEKFLRTPNLQIKQVFLELQTINSIAPENLNVARSYYWQNLNSAIFTVRYALSSNYSAKKKRKLILAHTYSLAKKNIDIKGYKDILNKRKINDSCLGEKQNGFYSLDSELHLEQKENLQKRLSEFSANTNVLDKRIKMSDEAFSKKHHNQHLNQAHLKKIVKLIKISEQQGIKLVFVIPPRLNNLDELLAIAEQLPQANILILADHNEYPELYRAENSFDVGHLNSSGAQLYTNYLAEKTKKILYFVHQ